MNMLETYRKQIDEIDEQIIKLLASRLEIVKKVWEWKKENSMQPLQPSRWQQVLESRKQLAKKFWISEELIEKIWNLIHEEALRLEE